MHIKGEIFINNHKNIVYVVESLGGGVFSYLKQLCNNLPKNFQVTVLYGVRNQTPRNLREQFNENIKLIEIKNFQRSVNPISDLKAYREVKKYIDEINPDIVHLNSSKAGAIGRMIKFIHCFKYKNVNFYYTPHGYAFLMSDTSKLKRNVYFMIEKILGCLNTKTIACGQGEYAYAKKISKNSTFVNNAVDTNYIRSFMNAKSNSENVVYTVGRINFQKNPGLFNKIALLNPNTHFVWIGDGPEKDQLSAKNIEITGWLPRNEVCKIVQSYKYFILCSRWEGLPVSLLEAMGAGKCCFVTNVSGNREVIDGNNGLIFDDAKDFTEKFGSLTSKVEAKLSSNAINDVNVNYSLSTFINGYSEIYDK